MFSRLFHLFVCLLLIGPLSAPGWATVRPENRVGGSPAFSSTFASQSASQVAESHRENPACVYDFASGVRKYLYAAANPVNMVDPSGHESIIGVSIATTIGTSLHTIYDGVTSGVGTALRASLFGAIAGKSAADILSDFVLEETGIQGVLDAYGAISSFLTSHGASQEVADLAVFYQHFDFASLPLLVEDNEYTATDLDEQEPQCFVAGTLILTEQGMRAIEAIKTGDNVWAYDIGSSNRVLKPVLKTFVRHRLDRIKLQIDAETVEVTGEHPFFLPAKGWVAAANLRAGDKLFTFDPDSDAYVRSAERLSGAVTVYNFEVQDLHDYFITDEGVLVHNLGAGFHHFLTKALGSKVGYGTRILRQAGKLSAHAHTALHQALNQHLRKWRGGNMMPSRGNSGALIRQSFSRNERLRALSEFYRNYNGGQYWKAFQTELKAMVQKGGGGIDPNLFQ